MNLVETSEADELDTLIEDTAIRMWLEKAHLNFTRYYFKIRHGIKMIVNWHHHLIADAVDDVLFGRRQNVVITVSPGGTKTELVVINLIARALALNARARFIHLSGSESLATLNSAAAREIVSSQEYQRFWPRKISDDASSKKRWNVKIGDQDAGGVYASASGGQVTGFRAGHMAPGFQGALLIDDPIKPEDAFSRTKVNRANRQILTTIKSRKANPLTPIILIMQRLAESDPVGFIERGNVEGDWDFIRIPAIIDEDYLKKLPQKYIDLIQPGEIVNDRFSYWPYKEPIHQLLEMERGGGEDKEGQRISRFVYASQYDQRPRAAGGNIIKGAEFGRWLVLPKIKYRKVYVDTAQKTKERNDYSVFEEWGYGVDGKIYLLDLIKGRWEAPELQRRAVAFWAQARARSVEHYGVVRKMMIEDKASGTGLIQAIKLPPYNIPVEGIERSTDKFQRTNDVLAEIEAGLVVIPEMAAYTQDFIAECEGFTSDDSHDFDDQIDPMIDAVTDMLQAGGKVKRWAALAKKGAPNNGTQPQTQPQSRITVVSAHAPLPN